MEFHANIKQSNELLGLAYHQADHRYRLERRWDDERITESELERDRRNIEQHFPVLDAIGVPFWVQNTVLAFAEDWRRYAGGYIREYLKTKNIFLEG